MPPGILNHHETRECPRVRQPSSEVRRGFLQTNGKKGLPWGTSLRGRAESTLAATWWGNLAGGKEQAPCLKGDLYSELIKSKVVRGRREGSLVARSRDGDEKKPQGGCPKLSWS